MQKTVWPESFISRLGKMDGVINKDSVIYIQPAQLVHRQSCLFMA
ncbi:hypothetical protein PEC302107_39280 [Pectobacterium araliae]|nr:hypothetical protein PEC302107_39280 [Pectobacterium carotovorum subsp. carotovorum]